MIFRSESYVRKWLRDNGGRRKLFWIEHRVGGTAGNLDCLIMLQGRLVPVECKKGSWNIDGDELQINLRADQKQVIRRLTDGGVASWVLVGEIGSSWLWLKSGSEVIEGKGQWRKIAIWKDFLEGITPIEPPYPLREL